MRGLKFSSVQTPIVWSQGFRDLVGPGTLREYIDQQVATAMPKGGGDFDGPITLKQDAFTAMAPTTLRQVVQLIEQGPGADTTRVYDFTNSGFSIQQFNSEVPPRTKVNLAVRQQDLPSISYPSGSILGINATGTIANALGLLQSAIGSGTGGGTGGFTNPMTGTGDMIRGGTNGAATRLAPGSNGQFLSIVSGLPVWTSLNNISLTGIPTAPTASPGTTTTQLATTAFVAAAVAAGGGTNGLMETVTTAQSLALTGDTGGLVTVNRSTASRIVLNTRTTDPTLQLRRLYRIRNIGDGQASFQLGNGASAVKEASRGYVVNAKHVPVNAMLVDDSTWWLYSGLALDSVTVDPVTPTASISPTSSTSSLTVGTAVNQVLGTIYNGTPISVSGSAPAGLSFQLNGQQLRLSGTPTTASGSAVYTASVVTSEGTVTFGATLTVATTVTPSISPASGTVSGTVGTAIDVLLATVSNGTPSGVAGTAPAGTAFTISGQQLRLVGTPTTAVSATDFTATVSIQEGGSVQFTATATIITGTTTATITPTSASVSITNGTAGNTLLGTVIGGTPTDVTGSTPAGTTFQIIGQQLRLIGTPTNTAGATAYTANVAISGGGSISFVATVTVAGPVASISPQSAPLSVTVGTAANVLAGTISNGTPTSVSGSAPDGLSWQLSGQQLRLVGTPTTASSVQYTAVVLTSNGTVNFSSEITVSPSGAVVATISPTSGTVSGTVGTALNLVLGTISNGTPTGISGTSPAGTTFQISGQQLKLVGTPTTAASATAYTADVATTGGHVTFVATATIAASSGGSATLIADLSFDGTDGQTGALANSASGGLTFVTSPQYAKLSTARAVTGTAALFLDASPGQAGGAVSEQDVSLTDAYRMECNFDALTDTSFGYGMIFAVGQYSSSSFMGLQYNESGLKLFREEGATAGGLLGTLFPFAWSTYGANPKIVLERDGSFMTTVKINDVVVLGPVSHTGTIAGKVSLLSADPGFDFAALKASMDNFKMYTGGGSITPPAASISPTSASVSGTQDTAMDVLLGTVSNGTPSGVTGTAPAGTAFTLVGQQLRLVGTPTTVASATVYTANVATSGGAVSFAATVTVVASGGSSSLLADLNFDGTDGQIGAIANAGDVNLTFATSPQYAQLSTARAVTGTAGLYVTASPGQSGGALSDQMVTLPGEFSMECVFDGLTDPGYGFGTVFAVGQRTGSSFIGLEYNSEAMSLLREQGASAAGVLDTVPAFDWADYPADPKVVLKRDGSFMVTVEINDVVVLGPVSHTGTITGRIGLLAQDPDFATPAQKQSMDGFKMSATGATISPPPASISPTTATLSRTQDVAMDVLLGTVSNGTPSGVTGTAPAGTSFTISGQQLRLVGTPTEVASATAYTANVATSGGAVSFVATVAVVAPVTASISPTSANVSSVVGTAVDVLLGTVSGGTPSGVTGTAPAGTAFTLVGQELRLVGTYSATTATEQPFTATVATSGGPASFTVNATIADTTPSDTLALLHLSEGSYSDRPAKFVNSVPSGLTFRNVGPATTSGGPETVGGNFWFSGQGPWGQAVNTVALSNAPMAIVCDQLVSFTKGTTHECYINGFDNGREIWTASEDGTGTSDYYIRTYSVETVTPGSYQMVVEFKSSAGVVTEACRTTEFTPVADASNWIVTQWTTDGHFEIWLNGTRLAVSAATYDDTLANCVFALFGAYDSVSHGTNGVYQKLISEFRMSKVQRYTGTTVAVPTARFTG